MSSHSYDYDSCRGLRNYELGQLQDGLAQLQSRVNMSFTDVIYYSERLKEFAQDPGTEPSELLETLKEMFKQLRELNGTLVQIQKTAMDMEVSLDEIERHK